MTTSPDVATQPTPLDWQLTGRALDLALSQTTDRAPDILRVPLDYYSDDTLRDLEESSILRRVPIAVLATAQIPTPSTMSFVR